MFRYGGWVYSLQRGECTVTQLVAVKVPRQTVVPERQETEEVGLITAVEYGSTEIVTHHGLRLLVADLGMEGALNLLAENADSFGWPVVLETPPELFSHTDCAGLIFRPGFFKFHQCMWWVNREGHSLIRHFGHGSRFAFTPELYEANEVRLD